MPSESRPEGAAARDVRRPALAAKDRCRFATDPDSAPPTALGLKARAAERKLTRRSKRSAANTPASTSTTSTGQTGSGAAWVTHAASISAENGAFCSQPASTSEVLPTARALARCAAAPPAGDAGSAAASVAVGASVAVITPATGALAVSDGIVAAPSAPLCTKGRYSACSGVCPGGVATVGPGESGVAASGLGVAVAMMAGTGATVAIAGIGVDVAVGTGETVDVTAKSGVAVGGGLAVHVGVGVGVGLGVQVDVGVPVLAVVGVGVDVGQGTQIVAAVVGVRVGTAVQVAVASEWP